MLPSVPDTTGIWKRWLFRKGENRSARMEDAKEKNHLSLLRGKRGGVAITFTPRSLPILLRRRLEPAKSPLTYGSFPWDTNSHMEGFTLTVRQFFFSLFSYINYAHERFLSIE